MTTNTKLPQEYIDLLPKSQTDWEEHFKPGIFDLLLVLLPIVGASLFDIHSFRSQIEDGVAYLGGTATYTVLGFYILVLLECGVVCYFLTPYKVVDVAERFQALQREDRLGFLKSIREEEGPEFLVKVFLHLEKQDACVGKEELSSPPHKAQTCYFLSRLGASAMLLVAVLNLGLAFAIAYHSPPIQIEQSSSRVGQNL